MSSQFATKNNTPLTKHAQEKMSPQFFTKNNSPLTQRTQEKMSPQFSTKNNTPLTQHGLLIRKSTFCQKVTGHKKKNTLHNQSEKACVCF